VGDDQYGEDPSTNRLQARLAEALGKEAALWLPSGTMSNQVALKVLTRPGDEVVASRESHAGWHEVGAPRPTPACRSSRSAAAVCSASTSWKRRSSRPGCRCSRRPR
jgi:threonine aldolase